MIIFWRLSGSLKPSEESVLCQGRYAAWLFREASSDFPAEFAFVRKRFTAKPVTTTNAISTNNCATAKGGSFWVGARTLSWGTFSNDCTTNTNTLKYKATDAVTT